jgi:hypothetical protein
MAPRARFGRNPGTWLGPAAVALCLLTASRPHAQLPCVCGDYDCHGDVTGSDIWEITRYLYQGPYGCLWQECRDVDGDGMITDRDVVWVWRAGIYGIELHCDSIAAPFALAPTNDFFLLYEKVYPAGDSVVPIHLDIVHWKPIAGFSVAFLIKVGGVIAKFDSPGYFPYPPNFIGKGELDFLDSEYDGPGLFGFTTGPPTLPPSRRPALTEINVHMPAVGYDRSITVELFDMDSAFVDPLAYRNSMVVDGDYDTYELTAGPPTTCPYRGGGDVIGLVNYVFKGGIAPMPCAPAGDANCDLAVNSSDVIQMVNFIFKSGPSLCDPCTAYAYPWGCP